MASVPIEVLSYPPSSGEAFGWALVALAPMAVLGVVSRRMGRGGLALLVMASLFALASAWMTYQAGEASDFAVSLWDGARYWARDSWMAAFLAIAVQLILLALMGVRRGEARS